MAIRFIRYDIMDGSVNDAFTIHTMEADEVSLHTLTHGRDADVLRFARKQVGLARGVTIDNSGDCGDRIELNDKHGDPCGAIAWDASDMADFVAEMKA